MSQQHSSKSAVSKKEKQKRAMEAQDLVKKMNQYRDLRNFAKEEALQHLEYFEKFTKLGREEEAFESNQAYKHEYERQLKYHVLLKETEKALDSFQNLEKKKEKKMMTIKEEPSSAEKEKN